MTPERWQQIAEIFDRVVDRPAAERADCLAQSCGDDQELRREVESLLAHESHDTFIEDPIRHAAQVVTQPPADDMIGRRLGPYRVTSLIGHGGMGAVYRAIRDDDQYQQQVALKLVKRGMDTDFVLDRFRSERQILASLEHPHIARLLDGGTTADSLPYFVMEYVEGQAITGYCETHQLSITERLKLFRLVCTAVQYAHQNLVVHRDLKPSNILVAKDGVVKLLDFGIAKLLTPEAADTATQTATGLRMMTPDYASPEQVRGLPITTATDIYSLGAVLYELLTGERPHHLENYSPVEIEQAICRTETERPSLAVSRKRGAPARLRKQLRGDLDNIVLMAMRKEPERRYNSVEQFSEDIRRYLDGLPVIARQDTLGYRTGKFIRRHKVGLAAVALVMLSLTGGIVASVYQARRADYQAQRAERRFQQVRKLANTFLFVFHDKIQPLGGSTEAREMVVKTALEYLDSLAQEAGEDHALQLELAQAYLKVGDVQGNPRGANLGHPAAALESYHKALALSQKLAARDGNDLNAQRSLSTSYYKVGDLQAESGDTARGVAVLRQGLQVAEPLLQRTGEEWDLVLVINLYTFSGQAQVFAGDLAAALANYRHARPLIERRMAKFPADHARSQFAASHNHIGETLASMGDPVGAMENFRQAAAIYEALSQKNPSDPFFRREMKVTYQWLGGVAGDPHCINLGDEQAARRYYHEGLTIGEELMAIDPKNAQTRFEMGTIYSKIGDLLADSDPARSADDYRQALTANRSVLESSPNERRFVRRQALLLRSLAAPLRRLSDHQNALQNLRQSLTILQTLIARYPANTQLQTDLHETLSGLGGALLEMGDHAGALENYRQALALAKTSSAARPADMYAQWRLADSYASLGQYHATLAAAPKAALTERIASWREARTWRQKSLAVWDDWSQHAVASVFNTTKREQAARALAQCEAALAKLGTPPER